MIQRFDYLKLGKDWVKVVKSYLHPIFEHGPLGILADCRIQTMLRIDLCKSRKSITRTGNL